MKKIKYLLLTVSCLLSTTLFAVDNDNSLAEKAENPLVIQDKLQVSSLMKNLESQESKIIHEELRNILKVMVTAINTEKYEDMNSVLSKDIEATPVNSEFLSGIKSVNDYFNNWFGANGKLKHLNISMNPDKLTWIHESGTIGIVSGSGVEKYELNDGRTYDFKTRWTATVIKEGDVWKMRSFNSSVNFLDNPLIDEIESTLKGFIVFAGIGSLFIGLIIGVFIGKRKK